MQVKINSTALLFIGGTLLLMSCFAFSASEPLGDEMNIPEQFIQKDFKRIFQREGKMGNDDITLIRYQRQEPLELLGEHISFVISSNGVLKGMVRLTTEFEVDNNDLPTNNKAKEVALSFLENYAPDLLHNMAVQWVKQHDENIITNGKAYTISGMKVKCKNEGNGEYFWVIVSSNNEVIVFERDIVWDFFRAGRQTEKWLHDSWLKSFFTK